MLRQVKSQDTTSQDNDKPEDEAVDDVAFEMDDVLISDNEESESDSSMDSGSDTERDFAVDSEIEP